jgi:hypothetical protein
MKKSLWIGLLLAQICLHVGFASEVLSERTVPLNHWKARNPGIVSVEESGSNLSLGFGQFPGRWEVVDGPEIPLEARTRFYKNRRCRISMEIKTTGLEGYAMQIRMRQRVGMQKEGGAFTRNLSPRLEWDAAAELDHADKFQTWAQLESVSTLNPVTERMALEIWLSTPTGKGPAKVEIRNVKITEMAEIEHVISSEPTVDGNLFFTTSGGMKADFVDPAKVKTCRIELFDETGKPLGKVEGAAGTSSLKITLPSTGYYAVQATAEYPDGKSITARTTAAVLGEPLDSSVRQNSRLGSFRVWGREDLWLKSGANWDWGIGCIDLADYILNADGTISPPKDAKPLSYSNTCKNIYTIGKFPKWVMPEGYTPDSLMAPKDWTLLEKLMEAFARQNPDLTMFCSFNEPDAHWRGNAKDFVKFHQVIAAGVKKGNPNMKFYGPCMYSIRMDDFRKYAGMGLLDCLDGLVMHAYVDGSLPEGKFIENVDALTKFLKENGRGEMPVLITEYGWCAEIGDWQKTISELERSQYAPRSIALLAAQPLDAIEYFVFKHASEPGKPGYSLLYSDNTPTPTYVSFVNTLKWLSWTQRGEGRWFPFSPKLNLTLFHREGKNTGVAWNTDGPARLTLPAVPLKMTDSMGRPMPVKDASVAVGSAPVFFDLPDSQALFQATTLPEIEVAPGAQVALPWNGELAAPEISLEGNQAAISPKATPGNYIVIGKADDAFQVQPIRVLTPLTLESLDFALSPDGTSLLATARVKSPIKEGAEASIRLTLTDGSVFETKARLKPGVPSQIEVAVPGFKMGQRCRGKVVVSLQGKVPFKIEKAVDQTFIFCPAVSNMDWKTVEGVELSGWNPFPKALKPEDCSASFKTAVTPQGFRLLVEVEDNIQYQTQLPSYMWNGDSIQFAFDVDADKEWQPNNVGNGYNGHRIFEYGVGLSAKGKAMVWRWRADAPGFNSGEEPRVVAEVKREGTKTTYDVLLPWTTLGLAQAPAPGSNMGFALVVNDRDGGTDTLHGLRIFGGIQENKNPEGFGRLHVKEVRP